MQLNALRAMYGSHATNKQSMQLKLQENWTIYEAGYNAAIQQNVHNNTKACFAFALLLDYSLKTFD